MDLILGIVMILVAAIMVDETAQAAEVAVAVVEAAVGLAAEVVVAVVVAVVAAVVAAVVVADVTVAEMAGVTVVEMADVVTATVPTISKVAGAHTTKVSRVILTHGLTEVTVLKGKKNHSKGDQRLVAEVIEAAESVTAELTNQHILMSMLRDRSI